MTTTTYNVRGMSCEHCVMAVTAELSRLDGVADVAVDLDSGRVTVHAAGPLEDTAVAAAVEGAGYQLAS